MVYKDEPDPDTKRPLDDSTFKDIPSTDAPPPYAPPDHDASSAAGPSQPRPSFSRPPHAPRLHISSLSSGPAPTPTSNRTWLSSLLPGSSKPTAELRTTTQLLLRDLVQHPIDTSPTSPESYTSSILSSCKDACASHGVDFSSILQEPFIEGHGPVYWAIVTRPRPRKGDQGKAKDVDEDEATAMVLILLTEMKPILPRTVSEVRKACMVNSDHAIFSIIKARFSRAFTSLSGQDEILLSSGDSGDGEVGSDLVEVEEGVGSGAAGGGEDDKAFMVRFEVVRFQLRMRVSGVVRVEWIAGGTLLLPVAIYQIRASAHLFPQCDNRYPFSAAVNTVSK